MTSAVVDFLVRMLPGILPAAILYFCLLPIRRKKLVMRALKSTHLHEVLLLVYLLFCGGLAVLTMTPRWFHWLSILTGDLTPIPPFFQWGNFNLTLLRTFSPDPTSMLILLGNVIMFIPLGFFPILLWRTCSIPKVMLIGFLSISFIECWQLLIGRTFDVDDFLLNLIGIAAGALLCRIFQHLVPKLKQICYIQPL